MYITFNQFYKSFVKERWKGERRSKEEYTIFGYVHTKTTTPNVHNGFNAVRIFKFPNTIEEAEKIHNEQIAL